MSFGHVFWPLAIAYKFGIAMHTAWDVSPLVDWNTSWVQYFVRNFLFNLVFLEIWASLSGHLGVSAVKQLLAYGYWPLSWPRVRLVRRWLKQQPPFAPRVAPGKLFRPFGVGIMDIHFGIFGFGVHEGFPRLGTLSCCLAEAEYGTNFKFRRLIPKNLGHNPCFSADRFLGH
jgi:hypothetical protein